MLDISDEENTERKDNDQSTTRMLKGPVASTPGKKKKKPKAKAATKATLKKQNTVVSTSPSKLSTMKT